MYENICEMSIFVIKLDGNVLKIFRELNPGPTTSICSACFEIKPQIMKIKENPFQPNQMVGSVVIAAGFPEIKSTVLYGI